MVSFFRKIEKEDKEKKDASIFKWEVNTTVIDGQSNISVVPKKEDNMVALNHASTNDKKDKPTVDDKSEISFLKSEIKKLKALANSAQSKQVDLYKPPSQTVTDLELKQAKIDFLIAEHLIQEEIKRLEFLNKGFKRSHLKINVISSSLFSMLLVFFSFFIPELNIKSIATFLTLLLFVIAAIASIVVYVEANISYTDDVSRVKRKLLTLNRNMIELNEKKSPALKAVLNDYVKEIYNLYEVGFSTLNSLREEFAISEMSSADFDKYLTTNIELKEVK